MTIFATKILHLSVHFNYIFLLQDHVGPFNQRTIETLQFLHEAEEDKAATLIEIRVPKNQEEKRYMGKPRLLSLILCLAMSFYC